MEKVYFDYAATTPMDDRVLEKMLPFFKDNFGNPSSSHLFGQKAENEVENAREMIAASINALPEEILITSGGTESDNFALRAVAFARRKLNGSTKILISPVEHHAISHTAKDLESNFGFRLEFVPVNRFGIIDLIELEKMLSDEVAVVSIIYANNEIGSINPVSEIGALCRKRGIPFHTDAVQAAAHLKMDVERDRIDLMSIGAHKFYGPKGIGALYIRKGTPCLPLQTGGKQENNRRAGTENVPSLVGLAYALKFAQEEVHERNLKILKLRDFLIENVLKNFSEVEITGDKEIRLSNHASFVFKNVDGNLLVTLLDIAGFACSSGSACKVGNPKPSEVLTNIGYSDQWALGSLRVTLGKDCTQQEIEKFVEILPNAIRKAKVSA